MSLFEEFNINEIELEGDSIDDETYLRWLTDLNQKFYTEDEIIRRSDDQFSILDSYYNHYYYSLHELVKDFNYKNNFATFKQKLSKIFKRLSGLIFCKLYVDKKKYILSILPNSTIYDIKYMVYKHFAIPTYRTDMIEKVTPYVSKKYFKTNKSDNFKIVYDNKNKLLCMEYDLSKKLIDNKKYYPKEYMDFSKKFFDLILDFNYIKIFELFKQYHPTDFLQKLTHLNFEKTIEDANYNIYLFNIFIKNFTLNLKKIGIEIEIEDLEKFKNC